MNRLTFFVFVAFIAVFTVESNKSDNEIDQYDLDEASKDHSVEILARIEARDSCKCKGSECTCCQIVGVSWIKEYKVCIHVRHISETVTSNIRVLINDEVKLETNVLFDDIDICLPFVPMCIGFKSTKIEDNVLTTCLTITVKFFGKTEIELGCINIGRGIARSVKPYEITSLSDINNNQN